jgi:hypothetical protein
MTGYGIKVCEKVSRPHGLLRAAYEYYAPPCRFGGTIAPLLKHRK